MFNLTRPGNTKLKLPQGYPSNVRTVAPAELIQVSRLKTQSLGSLRDALTRYLRTTLDQPIRQVVAYCEHTENYGGCSTCEHLLTVFDVYFKDSSGRLLIYSYDGGFSEPSDELTSQDTDSSY